MSRKKTNPALTTAPQTQVETIARLQSEIAQVHGMEIEIARLTDDLTKAITRGHNPHLAREVTSALTKHRVNVGQLSSRFSEALERRNHHVYPERYEPIRIEWSLVQS